MIFKRGASHADWAVSMGIFIIYILSMFIMVQPGAQKVFREDNLIQIVEEGIRNASSYTIERTPLYITLHNQPPNHIVSGSSLDFKLSGIDVPLANGNDDDFKLLDSTGAVVPITIFVANGKATAFYFTYTFTSVDYEKPYRFDLYYLKGKYTDTPEHPEPSYTDDGNLDNDVSNPPEFTSNFGSTEKIIGYDETIIAGLCANPDYKAFKANLGYPSTKDFTIYYVKAAAPGESVPVQYDYNSRTPVCEAVEPYQQASVFVKELVESFMDINGIKTQSRINIRVW